MKIIFHLCLILQIPLNRHTGSLKGRISKVEYFIIFLNTVNVFYYESMHKQRPAAINTRYLLTAENIPVKSSSFSWATLKNLEIFDLCSRSTSSEGTVEFSGWGCHTYERWADTLLIVFLSWEINNKEQKISPVSFPLEINSCCVNITQTQMTWQQWFTGWGLQREFDPSNKHAETTNNNHSLQILQGSGDTSVVSVIIMCSLSLTGLLGKFNCNLI